MAEFELLEPKEVTVTTLRKEERIYIISKFPCVAGREIIAKYPLSAMPKLGDYAVNEETMFKLMAFVGVPTDSGKVLQLKTKAMIDNHVPDWETLAKLEFEMMKYNTSFFGQGEVSSFLKGTLQKFLLSISPTWKTSLVQLLEAVRQRTKN